MFNMDARQMEKMMKNMGIQTTEIIAEEVIIKTKDKKLISLNPKISKIKMGGNEVMQITGDFKEAPLDKFSDEDVQIIVEQTGCTAAQAKRALDETGDIADAILKIKKEEA